MDHAGWLSPKLMIIIIAPFNAASSRQLLPAPKRQLARGCTDMAGPSFNRPIESISLIPLL